MTMHWNDGDENVETLREARARLSLFLPASVIHTLHARVPAGRRAAFVAHALRRALAELEQRADTPDPRARERKNA